MDVVKGGFAMRRIGLVFLLTAVFVAMGMGLGACSKKEPPPVEIPETPPDTVASAPIQPPKEVEPPPPPPVELADIFFEFDRANLRSDALMSMERNAEQLGDNTEIRVVLEGHCDERGTTEYNLALGERRARAAYDYLVRFGIDGGRLTVVSYGEERPFELGHTEAAWAKNRRVHFVKQ
jgi:peptidoglycan-associated lipoprotein